MGFNDDVIEGNLVYLGSASINSNSQNANNFLALFSLSRSTTEALTQLPLDTVVRILRMYALVGVNSKDAATVFALRNNGADIGATISYNAAETGRKSAAINVDVIATDLVNFRFDTSLSTAGSITAQILFSGFAARRPA